ncbi:hypothetical protein AB0I75_19340 [Streptomyces sp. NPDC050273]|uniref:hypothetical protein n=1 Tax=Streptomyces sp. NPDC050273 TaxID=3154933 RepID=UPI00343B18AD
MPQSDVDGPDRSAGERFRRWSERHADDEPLLPVPGWWPWPLQEVSHRDGAPDTGMVAVDLLPQHDRVNPEAVLVRQPREEAPFDYGWPGAAWHPEDDPELVVRTQQWDDGPWRWTLFVRGAPLPAEALRRIQDTIEWRPAWVL